ncbi:MAG: L,D-transpeptidase family protein [Bryobacteraceae bacterium]|nr:L,D-transpeptidase family protein [Bryobacteraceae bacterium]
MTCFVLALLLAQAPRTIIVTADGPGETTATLQRYENGTPVGAPVRVALGRAGMAAAKNEGDGRSPAGSFRIESVFGHAPWSEAARHGFQLPYRPLTSQTRCVDDPRSSHYNRILEETPANKDWTSAEEMLIPDYKWGAVISYNTGRPTPGAGSCIFLHVTRSIEKPTAGCTAMSEADLLDLLRWATPDTVLIQRLKP